MRNKLKILFSKMQIERLSAAIALIIFAVVTFIIFVMPQVNLILAVRRQYISQNNLFKERMARKERLTRIEESLGKIESEFNFWQDKFLAPGQITIFWNELSRLIGKNSQLEQLQPASNAAYESSGDLISTAVVAIKLRADFKSLLKILAALKEHKKFIRVDYMKIEEGDGPGELNIDLRLCVYIDNNLKG